MLVQSYNINELVLHATRIILKNTFEKEARHNIINYMFLFILSSKRQNWSMFLAIRAGAPGGEERLLLMYVGVFILK